MQIIYTIAGKSTQREHGRSVSVDSIQRQGSYGTGEFPPCFTTKEDAEKYLNSLLFSGDKKIVSLRLKDKLC